MAGVQQPERRISNQKLRVKGLNYTCGVKSGIQTRDGETRETTELKIYPFSKPFSTENYLLMTYTLCYLL